MSEKGTAVYENKNASGSRRALIVTVIVVIALIATVWLVVMTGALALMLDPEVEGLRAIGRCDSSGP